MAIHKDILDGLVHAREDGCAHGDVWDKVTVHDVHVNPLCAAVHHPFDFVSEVGEVGGEDGGGDDGADGGGGGHGSGGSVVGVNEVEVRMGKEDKELNSAPLAPPDLLLIINPLISPPQLIMVRPLIPTPYFLLTFNPTHSPPPTPVRPPPPPSSRQSTTPR